MSQPAKAQEPSMEEILASIRRIIADDETSKPPPKTTPPPAAVASPPPRAAAPPPAPPPPPDTSQDDIDAMLAGLDAAPNGAIPEQEPHDVLDLTEQMAVPETEAEAPNFQTIDGQPDVIFTDAPLQQETAHLHAEPAPPPQEPAEPVAEEPQPADAPDDIPDRGLLSSSTSAAVDSAFNALAHTVLVQNARTLEDLVREMLRPMLKSWLDDNLPSMVERIVKAEIERVSRGRG